MQQRFVHIFKRQQWSDRLMATAANTACEGGWHVQGGGAENALALYMPIQFYDI